MRTRTLIRLDWLVGLPLCTLAFLIGLPLRALRPAGRSPTDPHGVRRILVIKFLGMGSVLLATPLLRRLRQVHPEARITFLTFEGNAELVRRLECIDEVRVVSRTRALALMACVPRLLLALRAERYDLAIDLEFYSRLSNLVSWASGARRRVGFFVRARWRGSLLTDPVYFNPTLAYGRAVLALLKPLGIDGADSERLVAPDVHVDEATEATARLAALGVPPEGTLVVVNVNASDLCDERRWPGERYARLVERFPGEIAAVDRFVFIGTASEAPVVRDVVERIDPRLRGLCLDLAGRTSLVELIVLLRRAALMVTNDSGPLHLAAALGLPTVSLYGPETPALYGPVGANHLVFYAGHWCSPCLSVYNAKIAMCHGENECMRRITLDDVVQCTAVFCRERVGLAPPLPADRESQGALP
ncbi:MAG: glycosyltransferase family 9 protein [Planctomycetota bacterium]